ncbi:hypothetical protein ONZ45_g3762 [Pleurotus djamor]|nr:hypothetical protein ONZ45_g3762 [Pleurotus djamor]
MSTIAPAVLDEIRSLYFNHLTPPLNTSFWRSQSFTPMFASELHWNTEILGHKFDYLVETLTWRIDAFVYAVNAKPDSEFSKNGGAVYIVLVHSGSGEAGQLTSKGLEYTFNVKLVSRNGSVVKHLPTSNSGVYNRPFWNYAIAFNHAMQMFMNAGNETFTFDASFEDGIDIKEGQQSGELQKTDAVEWSVRYDTTIKSKTKFPVSALSLFKVDSLEPAHLGRSKTLRQWADLLSTPALQSL